MLRKSLYKDLDKFRKTRNSQKRKYYNKTVDATNRYLPWTKQEDLLVIQYNIPDRELSRKIQRSMNAILVRRNRLKNKIINKVIKESKEMKVSKFKRGQIWIYEMNSNYNGSIPGKTRPVIIMSNDLANMYSNCLLGIPCTTQEKKPLPTHTIFKVNDNVYNTALAENLMSLNANRLIKYLGIVDDELLQKLEYNIIIALGLEHYTNIPSPTNPVPIEKQMDIIKFDSNDLLPNEEFIQDKEDNEKPNIEPNIEKISYKKETNKLVKGRPSVFSGFTDKQKLKYLQDYKNHTKKWLMKKYNVKTESTLRNKAYEFRKSLGIKVHSKEN